MNTVINSLGNWFENVKTWLGTVNTSIWDGIKKIGEWFSNVISSLGEWFSDTIGKIVEFKDGVLAWFAGFFTWLWEMFIGLFVPADGFFSEKNNLLRSALESKLKYSEIINPFQTISNLVSRTPDNITCELYGKTFTIIDWKYILEIRPTIYFWVRGFYYPLFLVYQYNQIYKLIRGSSYVGNGKSGGEISGQMSFDFGGKK